TAAEADELEAAVDDRLAQRRPIGLDLLKSAAADRGVACRAIQIVRAAAGQYHADRGAAGRDDAGATAVQDGATGRAAGGDVLGAAVADRRGDRPSTVQDDLGSAAAHSRATRCAAGRDDFSATDQDGRIDCSAAGANYLTATV